MGDKTRGLYEKFILERTDGQSQPGRKHAKCDYFVLDMTHDPHAFAAVQAYAASCEAEYPLLAADLRAKYPGTQPVPQPTASEKKVFIDRIGSLWTARAGDGVVLAQISLSPDGVMNGAHDGTEDGKDAWDRLTRRIMAVIEGQQPTKEKK